MKTWPAVLTGLITVAVCLVVYLFEPPFLTAVSRQSFDALIRVSARPQRCDQVVIVDIDEASLDRYGHWPWPRFVLSRLADRLWDAGASVVAFDIVFAEHDGLSPAQVQTSWKDVFGKDFELQGVPEGGWSFDEVFAASLGKGNAVLGCSMDIYGQLKDRGEPQDEDASYRGRHYVRGKEPDRELLPTADAMVGPIRELAAAATGVAFIETTVDNDSIVRRTPLVCKYRRDRVYPSLALEAARLFLGADPFGLVYDDEGVVGVKEIRLRERSIPTDEHARLVLNYRSGPFRRVSVCEVMAGVDLGPILSNRIALVGTSAAGLRDLKATPVDPEYPGIEIQATAIENILSGDMLREPRWMFFANLGVMAVLGVLLTLLIARARSITSMAVTVLCLVAVVAASLWALRVWNLVLGPAQTVFCLLAVHVTVMLVKYWREEHERQRIRNMFGTMVSDKVLQYLEEHPGSFSLTGRKCEATAFFSDIAGFMTIAESLDPQMVQQFINRYMTPVTEIIMERDGLVNRFLGDAILAAWNVPYPVEDHAVHACLAALEQQAEIAALRDELRRDFGHVLRVRMGINTGIVTIGFMGYERRREYTLLGDAVNLASRFETANRDYGTSIIIGEATMEQAREHIEVRLLDLVVMRGETRPVRVYELLARKGGLPESRGIVMRFYEEALRLHWERKWDEAVERLERIGQMGVEDPPSSMLRQRIEDYRRNPPPAGWTGEHVKLTK